MGGSLSWSIKKFIYFPNDLILLRLYVNRKKVMEIMPCRILNAAAKWRPLFHTNVGQVLRGERSLTVFYKRAARAYLYDYVNSRHKNISGAMGARNAAFMLLFDTVVYLVEQTREPKLSAIVPRILISHFSPRTKKGMTLLFYRRHPCLFFYVQCLFHCNRIFNHTHPTGICESAFFRGRKLDNVFALLQFNLLAIFG